MPSHATNATLAYRLSFPVAVVIQCLQTRHRSRRAVLCSSPAAITTTTEELVQPAAHQLLMMAGTAVIHVSGPFFA